MRLQKYLASCGVASRRKAEILIAEGRVKINGSVADRPGTKVESGDKVEVDGRPIVMQEKIYIVLNKPPGYLCEKGDKWGRKTVYDLIENSHIRGGSIFTAGRLDYASSGLLILTNDGEFANNIIHPSKEIVKKYRVISAKNVPQRLIDSFINGIVVEGVSYKALGIERTAQANQVFIRLMEGKKREIRMVYRSFGLDITQLQRIAIAGLTLKNLGLPEGQYKLYTKEQIYGELYENSR